MRELYMDVLIKRPEIARDLHARLLHAAHQVQTDSWDLAVSFPDWRKNPGEFGLLFRLFGANQQILDAYRGYVAVLVENELIRLFPVLPVPQTQRATCFARDQHINKSGPAAARRRVRRGGAEEVPAMPRRCTHWLNLRSSSGHTFALAVRKCNSAQQGGHQYGLGFLLPDF